MLLKFKEIKNLKTDAEKCQFFLPPLLEISTFLYNIYSSLFLSSVADFFSSCNGI